MDPNIGPSLPLMASHDHVTFPDGTPPTVLQLFAVETVRDRNPEKHKRQMQDLYVMASRLGGQLDRADLHGSRLSPSRAFILASLTFPASVH